MPVRTRRVNLECGCRIIYDSFVPSPGDTITCYRCEVPTTVLSVDNRQLGVVCPECNKTVARFDLQSTLSASVVQAKHNVTRQHHSTIETLGDIDEQPCLIPNPVPPESNLPTL